MLTWFCVKMNYLTFNSISITSGTLLLHWSADGPRPDALFSLYILFSFMATGSIYDLNMNTVTCLICRSGAPGLQLTLWATAPPHPPSGDRLPYTTTSVRTSEPPHRSHDCRNFSPVLLLFSRSSPCYGGLPVIARRLTILEDRQKGGSVSRRMLPWASAELWW